MGSEAKAEGMTGSCKVVSAGPEHRGRTQEGRCELDARPQGYCQWALHWDHKGQAGGFEGAARHTPLANCCCLNPLGVVMPLSIDGGSLQHPGECVVDKPETWRKVAVGEPRGPTECGRTLAWLSVILNPKAKPGRAGPEQLCLTSVTPQVLAARRVIFPLQQIGDELETSSLQDAKVRGVEPFKVERRRTREEGVTTLYK